MHVYSSCICLDTGARYNCTTCGFCLRGKGAMSRFLIPDVTGESKMAMKWYTQCCVFVEAASLRLLRCVTSIVWLLEQCWGNLAWPPSPSDCFAAGCRSRWVSEQSSPWQKGCHNDTQLLVMLRRRFFSKKFLLSG